MSQPNESPRRAAQRAINAFPHWPVYLVGALPGLWTFWLAVSDQLGADPVKTLEHMLGLWALRFLIASLTVTPLRRIGGPNLVRFRRALGLLAFFYACAHLLTWIALDRGPDLAAILGDIVKRPYITLGMATFAILVPLAWTSNARAIKRMGAGAWQRLHRWVYLAAILAIAHYLLSLKSWTLEPLAYAAAVTALLLFRVFSSPRGNRRPTPAESG
ncbi:protein-methionine-sulfoxide reductase heme-binding subunit MsrQ [Rhodomicrobium sp. Az07]|uniref:protein-methionine-sulfoxide reductase heme-binding subunit MsrQ n=1 Tax=Rhodomicrobium sp. Az07 TaxID=2839034 RepID=UPI001BE571ED|nr:protein-methionine-sulfoxide reductase heme-binding subunit MsrQ [Rhodomicrobium sp. Az07]MBT3071229.1 protein-methionine-sulfoxide reductase heme-binding subunit MsrQ [Rhodomicrobium sp. Az07]